MRKVLIITFYFDGKQEFASAQPWRPTRMQGLFRYLPAAGWQPTVLTAANPEIAHHDENVVRSEYIRPGGVAVQPLRNRIEKNRHLMRLVRLGTDFVFYPDEFGLWRENAFKDGTHLLESGEFDAIISSSRPVSAHLIAHQLKEKYGVPWIADLRDLWTQNHYYPDSHTRLRILLERRLERKTLAAADALTTVSEPLAETLKRFHTDARVYSIPNGFDPELMAHDTPVDGTFRIVYTGHLYQGKRDPELLFAAARALVDAGEVDAGDLRIDFYGFDADWLHRAVEKHRLQDVVRIRGLVPRGEAVEEQRKAQLLLLLTWNDPEEKGVYTGKLFEYLAAQRPILSMGYEDGGVVKELLDRTKAGVHVSRAEDLKAALRRAYGEYKARGIVAYHGRLPEIRKYSHEEMAKKFAAVLDSIAAA